MTNPYAIEIVSGILSSVLLGTIYKIYKYAKKNHLFFLDYDQGTSLYNINTDKQSKVIEKNILNLEKKIEAFSRSLSTLKKSKLKFDKTKLEEILYIVENFERAITLNEVENDNEISVDIIDN